jgi:hypothetical protein
LKKPTQIDWARLAAYIDGEGCIDIHLSNPKKHTRPTPNLYLRVAVVNTDPRLLAWCVENFGGSVSCRALKGKYKPLFRWDTGSRMAASIIKNCYPFLIIKREQAEIAMAFAKTIGTHGKPITEEVLTVRLEMRKRLSLMKSVVGEQCKELATNSIQ